MLNTIATWDDADRALKELAQIERAVAAQECSLNQNIDDLKNLSLIKLQPIFARQKELAGLLKKYATARKGDFKDKRSRELTFGTIGFRQSSSLVIGNAKDLIARLKTEGMIACYKSKETVDKTELGKFKDSVLDKLGVRRKYKDAFYYTVKAEEVPDNG